MGTNQKPVSEMEDLFKAAATRMCDHFKAKGHMLKHSDMLEALSKGLGTDNYRKLKATLDAPKAKSVKPKKKSLPLGQMQSWSVEAIYTDNNQQYGDSFSGRTPLEAAYNAMMDRLTDGNLEIWVTNVRNEDGECVLSPSYITEIELQGNRYALKQLYDVLDEDSCADANALTAYRWLEAVLLEYSAEDMLEDLTDGDELEKHLFDPATMICEGNTLTPTQALELLCGMVEQKFASVMELEEKDEDLAKSCYQVRAMCSYFKDYLDSDSAGLGNFELTPTVA